MTFKFTDAILMSPSSRLIRFTKMHGIGNDYVYVDGFHESLDGIDLPVLAHTISDRHRGVGSDGLILIVPPLSAAAADVRMEMYNADGSRGEMCGNGIRCVAKYAVEHGLVRSIESDARLKSAGPCTANTSDAQVVTLRVQTDAGVLPLTAFLHAGRVERVRVDMGAPILSPRDIPAVADNSMDLCLRVKIEAGGHDLNVTCVSLGNPHAVTFVEDAGAFDLIRIGPAVERHPMFPRRVNFHVVQVHSRREATLRTWERGSGVTQACGTGACAVLVAGVLEDRLSRAATLHLPGGDLEVEWAEPANRDSGLGHVFKTGPAVEVFTGTYCFEGRAGG